MTTVVLGEAARPTYRNAFQTRLGVRAERVALGTAFIMILFVAWELVTTFGIEPPIILPSPGSVRIPKLVFFI